MNKPSMRIERIEFVSDGFKQILLSDGVRDEVDRIATGIQERASGNLAEDSEGFDKVIKQGFYGGGRWVAFVGTTDHASCVAEADRNILSGAIQ